MNIIGTGLTFDDVLLLPQESQVLPRDVDIKSKLTPLIKLNIPIVAAAMDTVSDHRMGIAIAKEGGIAIIHKNCSIEEQCKEVRKVKRHESWMITKPVTLLPNSTVKEAKELQAAHHFSGFPIIEANKLVGILTNRDFRFETNLNKPVKDLMTPKSKLITAKENTSSAVAEEIMNINRIEKLPIITENYELVGLITIKDINKTRDFPISAKDSSGRLIVGSAIGVNGDSEQRAKELIQAGIDVLVIDTAHGHHVQVAETVKKIKQIDLCEVIAGNVATFEAAESLFEAGADAVKVGIGPGSICTTRIVSGVGVPQLWAIDQCLKAAQKANRPIIADGGIKYSGDITKALAAGASTVMIGSLLAGTDESPGEKIIYEGRTYKSYRGMGSIGAMKQGSSERYFQELTETKKLVPEGVEGKVPYRGTVKDYMNQLTGGLRAGMGYLGAPTIPILQSTARFIQITGAGQRESHVHDVTMTKEPPNYQT